MMPGIRGKMFRDRRALGFSRGVGGAALEPKSAADIPDDHLVLS